jgi:hypothetical protein
MAAAKVATLLDNISRYALEEDRIVTYRWLSMHEECSSNMAKQLLALFAQQNAVLVSVVYCVTGVRTHDNARVVVLTSSDKLDATKSALSPVTSVHIYSVQKQVPKDVAVVAAADRSVHHQILQSLMQDRDLLFTNPHSPIANACVSQRQRPAPSTSAASDTDSNQAPVITRPSLRCKDAADSTATSSPTASSTAVDTDAMDVQPQAKTRASKSKAKSAASTATAKKSTDAKAADVAAASSSTTTLARTGSIGGSTKAKASSKQGKIDFAAMASAPKANRTLVKPEQPSTSQSSQAADTPSCAATSTATTVPSKKKRVIIETPPSSDNESSSSEDEEQAYLKNHRPDDDDDVDVEDDVDVDVDVDDDDGQGEDIDIDNVGQHTDGEHEQLNTLNGAIDSKPSKSKPKASTTKHRRRHHHHDNDQDDDFEQPKPKSIMTMLQNKSKPVASTTTLADSNKRQKKVTEMRVNEKGYTGMHHPPAAATLLHSMVKQY